MEGTAVTRMQAAVEAVTQAASAVLAVMETPSAAVGEPIKRMAKDLLAIPASLQSGS